MKSLAALIALLALITLPAPAGASDDHSAREVRERFGAPAAQGVVSCGAETSGAAVRCLRWLYDSGSTHAVFFFEPASERLLAVFTWEDGIGGAIDASDQVKSLLHASRNTGEP